MGAVVSSPYDREDAAAGDLRLELIAVRYTGEQTLYDVTQHLTQAGWPSRAPLDGGARPEDVGAWTAALVADRHLAKYEGRPDIEVVYADERERFAGVILDMADAPERALENVFGPRSDDELRQRVFDALGLDTVARAGPFEEQLRDLAGRDAPDDDGEDRSVVAELTDAEGGYSRSELGAICKELRSDAAEFNLRENAGKTDRAEFIAGFDRDERAAAIAAALDDAGDEGGEG